MLSSRRIDDTGLKVRWFGLVGDAVTDDTEALHKIFDYVNRDIFKEAFIFGKSDTLRGIGAVKAVEHNAEDIYAISDTLDMSTNVQLIGNGAAFRMLAAGAGKTMLRIRYFNSTGRTSYGTQFNAISDIKLTWAVSPSTRTTPTSAARRSVWCRSSATTSTSPSRSLDRHSPRMEKP